MRIVEEVTRCFFIQTVFSRLARIICRLPFVDGMGVIALGFCSATIAPTTVG